MAVLAIDTSTKACVLGVRAHDESWVDETILGRTHSEELLPRIDALLNLANIDKSSIEFIVYGQGPGSFTGLRIGIGVVQGLAFGLDIPVVGVSTLACLAQQALNQDKTGATGVIVALAARNTEVYFGAYKKSDRGVTLVGQEGVFEAAEVPEQEVGETWIGIGDGWVFEEALGTALGVNVPEVLLDVWPKAADLLDLGIEAFNSGEKGSASEALPEYLREQVAMKPSVSKRNSPKSN